MELLDKKSLQIVFTKLLQSKGAWNSFFNNVLTLPNEDMYYFPHGRDLNKLFEEHPKQWLLDSFDWETSKEKERFWEDLNEEWKSILEQNII